MNFLSLLRLLLGKSHIEADMLSSFQAGEEKGFTYIFNQYFPALSIYALRFAGNMDSARDIVQEAFENLWKQRENFYRIIDVKSYLYRIVHNVAILKYRNASKSEKALLCLPPDETFDQTIYDSIVKAEFWAEISRMIDSLPEGIAKVIRLYYIEGRQTMEIAHLLNIPFNTVRSRRHKGLIYLRQILPGYFKYLILLVLPGILS